MRSVTLGADHVRLSGIKKVLLKKGLGGSVGGKDVCVCICVCVLGERNTGTLVLYRPN